MDLGLKGKSAFLFGAGRGMGAATARVLAGEGARPVLFALNEQPMRALAEELGGGAGATPWHTIDMMDTASVDAVTGAAMQAHGVPDLVLISAGAAQGGLFWDIPDQTWDDALGLKFMGMVRVLRVLAPLMKERGSGRIVVIVGNNGKQPYSKMLPGSAANAACLAVVRGLGEELALHGVTISALNPGPTRTDRWTRLIDRLARETGRPAAEIDAERMAEMPKGRIGTAEEMAHLAVMLMSDHADMVTGVSLTVDGGATKAIA